VSADFSVLFFHQNNSPTSPDKHPKAVSKRLQICGDIQIPSSLFRVAPTGEADPAM
jgi:hypothetical protein